MPMNRIEEEKQIFEKMIYIYCEEHGHAKEGLCSSCTALLEYAFDRLDRCPFGVRKPNCKNCHIHCYKPQMRQQVGEVMQFTGVLMLMKHPVATITHLLRDFKKPKPLP